MIKLFKFFSLLILLLPAIFLAAVYLNHEDIPKDARYSSISLDFEEPTPSKAFFALGEAPEFYDTQTQKDVDQLLEQMTSRPNDETLHMKARQFLETHASSLALWKAAILNPGCSPSTIGLKVQSNAPRNLMLGGTLAALELNGSLRSAAGLEMGLKILTSLSQKAQNCNHDLLVYTLISTLQYRIGNRLVRAIEDAALAPKTRESTFRAIMQVLKSEKDLARVRVLQNAIRLESHQLSTMFRKDMPQETTGRYGMSDTLLFKPFWDLDVTVDMMEEHMRAQVFAVGLPIKETVPNDLAVDLFLDAISTPGLYFRYNMVGLILFRIAGPNFRKYRIRVEEERCRLRESLARLQFGFPALRTEKILNPLTGKPFEPSDKNPCTVALKALKR